MTDDVLYRALGLDFEVGRRGGIARPVLWLFWLLGSIATGLMAGACASLLIAHPNWTGRTAVAVVPIVAAAPNTPPAVTAPALVAAKSTAAETPVEAGSKPPAGPSETANGDTVEYQNGVKIIRLGAAHRASLEGSLSVPVPGAP